MKRSMICSLFCFALWTFSYGQNYSVKNRWNTKLSVSCNRTNEPGGDYFMELDRPLHPIRFRFNVRAECNYGVTNWLEVGGYLGYIRYFNFSYAYKYDTRRIAFAPTFGVNANVHLLPFLNVNKNCRWEWYVTAKYGGTYLINHSEGGFGSVVTNSNGGQQFVNRHWGPERYRNIFGVGMGGGVYFKNLVGIYTEVMAGQYSYFPELCPVYWTARVGIEFKFTPNKKAKNKEE